ncbi:ferrochelatase [Paracidobacterium acidisoli]|uniref:Ferrochelatase n=1 Tax=Paracidobacterium acidisoli TaxID=2303751 RepID=A0A372INY7_9BACT|nr:ferrochelatase [Paracidobacterium acidisoli]MBT9331952.1 ferrochelatase [Paracidobacterium acidisoli]
MSHNSGTAVLLLAHGTPDSVEEIPQYLSNITGGRPMPPAVIEEVSHRFSLVGGSPLTALTLEQARLLRDELCLPVYVGMRNWKPYIADVIAQMKADGIHRAVTLCLAPQNSRTSVGLYRKAVFTAAGPEQDAAGHALQIHFIEGWADHPLLVDAFAERLRAVLDPFVAETGSPVPVLFTAHSVPCRTVLSPSPSDPGTAPLPPDPYAVEAKRTASLVAERAGLAPDQCFFAFQSQGMSGGPWLGPTVEDTLTALERQGVRNIIVDPIGFLCDHVEILYDIDIGFREFAANLGMTLRRPESLNNSPLLTAALADLARSTLDTWGVR